MTNQKKTDKKSIRLQSNHEYKKPEKSFQRLSRLSWIIRLLYLDLNLNTTGEFELHQCVDGLGGRAVDVNQTLIV